MVKQMKHEDLKIISKDIVYDGWFKMFSYKLKHRLANGQWSDEFTREFVGRPEAAGIIPYDPILDKVVLIYQFRPGIIQGETPPWKWEVPAGIVDREESFKDLAIREAYEESGMEVTDIFPISKFWSSPGGSNERVTAFCGIVNAENAGGVWGEKNEQEDIQVKAFSFSEAFLGIEEGWINDALSIITLQWLAINRDKIRGQYVSNDV